ncbi:MAG: helix-turn-helix domain-containing protein [Nocardioidaceae bacterium]|nr:helix-turn-helix domain-containing protein [Nocardioidaceae bacterium]
MSPADEGTGEGELARGFLVTVGSRIRALRAERSMTVQQLADRAEVSRRLMTQIELGQANPSLVAITRIARQLGTEFTELLSAPAETPVQVHAAGAHVLVWSSEAGSTAHLLAASDTRAADLWLWRLLPGDGYAGRADPARSQELFYVLSGSLTLAVDGLEVVVGPGASSRLRSDRAYTYANPGTTPVTFVRTVALTP